MFYFIAGKETSELLINELGSIISHHEIRYSEMGENVSLDKPPSLGHYDGGQRLYFYPFSEVVDCHDQAFHLSRGKWERT